MAQSRCDAPYPEALKATTAADVFSRASLDLGKTLKGEEDSEQYKMPPNPPIGRATTRVLRASEVFVDERPRTSLLLKHFLREGRLSTDAAVRILQAATKLLRKEPTVMEVSGPCIVVGDIHGQFYDLVRILKLSGPPSKNHYVFLGDYVDRGYFSMECVLYLWALKVRYPKNITLLRGNHECRHLTQYFTFLTECTHKFNDEIYELCMESFDCLPLAAVVDKTYLCVHGGLSPEISSLEDIRKINRFQEPPAEGPMCDVLWADPGKDYGASATTPEFFVENPARGCSYYFTYHAVCRFLERNTLLCLIRAHEVQDAGFQMYDAHYSTGFPSMICVFSAPNYLDVYGNKGAILCIDKDQIDIKQFVHTPHPYCLPKFMDVFSWSLPFIGEKVTEILHAVVTDGMTEFVEQSADAQSGMEPDTRATSHFPPLHTHTVASRQSTPASARREVVLHKIKAVGKMALFFRVLREEREHVVRLKGLSPDGQLPPGALGHGRAGLLRAITNFDDAKSADAINERLPPAVASTAHAREKGILSTLDRAITQLESAQRSATASRA